MGQNAARPEAWQPIEALLARDGSEAKDVAGQLLRLDGQQVAQEALEQAVTDALGRGTYDRPLEGEALSGYRKA